jgi:photosystem II stability/assembly factor-like uncharacterized protein
MYAASVTDLAVVGSVIVRASPYGVDRSTDNGVTFTSVQGLTNGDGRAANLRCDGDKTCYASAHNAGGFEAPVVFKSSDAGATWTSTGKVSFQVLAVGDARTVYVTSSNGSLIERSDDGGATWSMVFRPTTQESFAPDCDGPFLARGSKLFAACRDGVYRSDDRGAHWVWAVGSAANGAITGSAWMALADTTATALGSNGDLYVSASTSGGRSHFRRSIDDGKTWQELTLPNVGQCLVMEKGAVQCTGTRGIYDEFIFQRSEDHGATWKEITVYPPATPPGERKVIGIVARRGSNLYVVGKEAIARSEDDGLTFQMLPGIALPFLSNLQILRSGHLLAGASVLGEVHRSTDRGITWKKLERGFGLPVLEDESGRILSYSRQGDLTASDDEGQTWTYLPNTGLPLVSTANPGRPAIDAGGRFYFLTGLRLYVSGDRGVTWEPLPNPLPNPNVTAFFNDRKGRLLAATSGGIYRLE